MNMIKKILLLLGLLYCYSQYSYAQNFPVQISPIGSRPYPNNLPAYAASTSPTSPLQLRILLTDITTGNQRPINLRIRIQGQGINVVSNPVFVQNQQLTLDAGIPLVLGAVDLAPYFEFQNLIGISLDQYQTSLRDGSYDFCFEIIDARSGVQISETKCVNLPVLQINPPFLTWPLNESKITASDPPPQINFNWSPASGGNVAGVKYRFRLVQIPFGIQDIQGFMLGTQGVNNCEQNNDSYSVICRDNIIGTSLAYNWYANPEDNPLLEDYIYAWQVQAYVDQNGEQVSTFFENFGRSQVFWFRYQRPCVAPGNIRTLEIGARTATIGWNLESTHIDYIINYREKGVDSRWYPLTTPRNTTVLSNLKPGTRYEYQVAGNCDAENVAYGQKLEFETVTEDVAMYQGCGIEPSPYTIDPDSKNLDRIYPGFVIIAGDFPITVTELDKNTSPFIGKGYVGIPWLGLPVVAVVFDGITVNEKLQLTSGVINTTYDATFGNFPGFDPPDDPDDESDGGNDQNTIIERDDVDDVQVNNGTIEIIVDGQVVETLPLPAAGTTVTIRDADGNEWTVDDEGNIQPPGGIDPGDGNPGGDTSGTITDGLTADGLQVNFLLSGTYGFDQIPVSQASNLLNNSTNEYVSIKAADSITPYYIPHKAIKAEGEDIIIGAINVTDSFLLKTLAFKTADDVKLNAAFDTDSTLVTISLNGANTFKKEDIKAVVSQNGQEKLAGVFTLWHLPEFSQPINVTIVPVNGSNVPSKVQIQKEVEDILSPGLGRLNFSIAQPLSVYPNLVTNEVEVWSPLSEINDPKYSGGLKYYINEFKKNRPVEDNQYYLFITDEPPSEEVTGAMLPSYQFGFIFENQVTNSSAMGYKTSLAKTIAHHLGQGIFGLSYANALGATSGETSWLMDPRGIGVKLPHMHWKQMHQGFTPYVFADKEIEGPVELDEEFQFSSINFGENGDGTYTFLTPAGEAIILPKTVGKLEFYYGYKGRAEQGDFKQFINFIPGALKGFTIQDKRYEADIEVTENGGVLKGYKSGDDYYTYEAYSIKRKDVTWGNLEDDAIVFLYDKLYKLKGREINVTPYSYESKPIKTVFNFSVNVLATNNGKRVTSDNKAIVGNGTSGVSQDNIVWAFKNIEIIQGHLILYHKIAELKAAFPHILTERVANDETRNLWHTSSCEDQFLYYRNSQSLFINHLKNTYCKCERPPMSEIELCEDKDVENRPATQLDFSIKFLEFLRKDIERILADEVQDIFVELNKNDSCDYIADIEFDNLTPALNAGTEEDLKSLNAETIICILSKYADKRAVWEGSSFRNSQELAMIRLLENVDNDDARGVIEGLEGKNIYNQDKVLYKQLFDKIDDSTLGFFRDNRFLFINALINIAFSDAEFYKERVSLYYQDYENRNFVQQYRNIVRRLAEEAVPFKEFMLLIDRHNLEQNDQGFFTSKFGYLDIDTDYNEESGTFSVEQELKFGVSFPVPVNETVQGLRPFDLIRFLDDTNNKIILRNRAKSLTDYAIPAVVLLYADQTTTNRTIAQSINTAIDVASISLTLGSGIAVKAGKLALARSIADDLGSLTLTGLSDYEENPFTQQLSNALALKSLLDISFDGIRRIRNADVATHKYDPPSVEEVTNDILRIPENDLTDVIANDRAHVAIRQYLEGGKDEARRTSQSSLLRNINNALERTRNIRIRTRNASGNMGRSAFEDINGFSDNIATWVQLHKINNRTMTVEDFITLQKFNEDRMSPRQLAILKDIRDRIPDPTPATIMQKVIPKADFEKYITGEYTVRGFITTAKDSKHLSNYNEIYHGMRLDYDNTKFNLSDGSCGVIRFRANNVGDAYIPRDLLAPDRYPFTNHGTTAGTNGQLGVPELKMDVNADLQDGAEFWEVFSDGSEVLRAKYSASENRFIPIQ